MNKSKEKSVDELINSINPTDDFSFFKSAWKLDIILTVVNFLNKISELLDMIHKCLKGIKNYFRKRKKCEDMTIEEFCQEMNCTTEYFEQLCSDIKAITSYSDEECIRLAKATFFGDYMQDIDAETASKNLQEVMEKYELK